MPDGRFNVAWGRSVCSGSASLALAIGGSVRENLTYCVILPAYNEGRHLSAVVSRIPDWVDRIIIVDDASTDDTPTVAESLTDARVQVHRHERNRGVGGAMVTGFRAALDGGFDVAIKMDADGQMDAHELSTLVRPIELNMAEYVKGNRFRRTGRPAAMPRRRWFGNVVLSFLTKVASGYWHVFDPQCGFIAITAPTLCRLKLDGMATDYFFENDMLIRLNIIDARVVDVDIRYLGLAISRHTRALRRRRQPCPSC
jgi:glycosyltransferase involved in cell wall biosynthesis